MKRILVGIKRVVDYNVRIRVKPDGTGVVTDGVKMSINPFDEIALEEALRIKERGGAEEVVVATIGPADVQQQLRTALAMGADRALHVQADGIIEPLVAARALLKLVEKEQPFLVIVGKQAIDDDNSQTGPMLAALWNRPQVTFASKVELSEGKARVTGHRENSDHRPGHRPELRRARPSEAQCPRPPGHPASQVSCTGRLTQPRLKTPDRRSGRRCNRKLSVPRAATARTRDPRDTRR